MQEIVLATHNPGKLAELQALIPFSHCVTQQSLGISSVEETGLSFIENAILKARHASFYADKPSIADDSGLVVPFLQGEPGIYSARYAEKNLSPLDNINYLLDKLKGTDISERYAFFYCVLVFINHAADPTPRIGLGKVDGHITSIRAGDNGFGYDPIFYLPKYECTMAELKPDLKNKISHRAHAFNQLKEQLQVGNKYGGY